MTSTYNGERYLMAMTHDGQRTVMVYTQADMTELFSVESESELNESGIVEIIGRDGTITVWIDMIQSATATFYGE